MKQILIADDEELVRSIVRLALGGRYQLTEAADGEEAWQKFCSASPKFDLAILDLNMPRFSGRELLERIVARDPNARVVLLTGRPDCEIDPHPGVRVIQKPFDNSTLAKAVADLLALTR